MTSAMAETVESAERPTLAARLTRSSDGILEQIAKEYGVTTLEVVRALPVDQRTLAPAAQFEAVMMDVSLWGEIMFIVHTPDIVLECAGPLPPGSFARGYFNLHGDSPIGGHIPADRCQTIAFVARPFMGRPSRSIQFFNAAGEAMFKIFVRRNEARELLPEQIAKFEALRQYCEAAAVSAP
jgi:putative heme utilization carrier protein HutX